MDAYGAVQCVFCDAQWTSAFDGDWECPCSKCHPDYRVAYAGHVAAPAAAAPAAASVAANPESDDEDMGWYNEKKKEWAGYADELKAQEEEEEYYD